MAEARGLLERRHEPWVTLPSFLWLILLLLMTLSDYLTRGPGWLHFG